MSEERSRERSRVAIVGPVFPYRAGIAYCTTRLAEELTRTCDVEIVSFRRQYPKRFYPGSDDVDPSLESRRPAGASFRLDIINPLSWLSEAWRLRGSRPDAVILVWWIWVWSLPYLVLLAFLPRKTRVLLQCHNITDKEPAWWKSRLTNLVLRRGDALVVHAKTEAKEARNRVRSKRAVIETFLPVHELGGEMPDRLEAKRCYGLEEKKVALFFGHVRPFKGLDVALEAVAASTGHWVLFVAGEVWWNDEQIYREMVSALGLTDRVKFDFRFIPDEEIASVFAASDLVVAPYRREAQSGVALTAFHFGRPVVATAVGGLPEIIEEGTNGFLVPSEDPGALASTIDRVFAEDLVERMSAGARVSAAQYSWPRYAEVMSTALVSPAVEEPMPR